MVDAKPPIAEHELWVLEMDEANEPSWFEMLEVARRVICGFDRVEQRPWTIETEMMELSKQVGDLTRHVVMAERCYLPDRETDPRYRVDRNVIGDELADILYCLIRIADRYGIDLARAHMIARAAELRYLSQDDEDAT